MSQVLAEAVLTPPRRTPQQPTAFLPGFGDPRAFDDLEDLEHWLRMAAEGQPLSFCAGQAAYPGFDGFPSVTAYAGGAYLATLAIPGVGAGEARDHLVRVLGQPEDAA